MTFYTITARLYQCKGQKLTTHFRCVEKAVWKYAQGGTWDESNGCHVLTMGGSGNCGSMRFEDGKGGAFIVTVGVHNYKRWCHVVTDIPSEDTCVIATPKYYNEKDFEAIREKQLTEFCCHDKSGRKYTCKYTVWEGEKLECDIICE
jgi:hypothetical protein